MGSDVHMSRLAVRHGATMLDAADPHATVYCAMAKREATERGFKVCDEALQLVCVFALPFFFMAQSSP